LKLHWLTTGQKNLTSRSKSNSNQALTSQASNNVWFQAWATQCSNVFIEVRNICFTSTSYLVLLYILFVLKAKLGTFLPIHRCWF